MKMYRAAILTVTIFAATVPAAAGTEAPVRLAANQTAEQVVDRVITAVERRIIERYYGHPSPGNQGGAKKSKNKNRNKKKGGKSLPPGLAKKGKLPPGLAKRKHLPPGLAKRDLPHGLYGELPKRAFGRLYRVDDRIVLIDAATNVVLDFLEDVIADP